MPNDAIPSGNRHPDYLLMRDCIRQRGCMAFIGSGLSKEIYGDWRYLVKRLCEACGIPESVEDDTDAKVLQTLADKARDADEAAYCKCLAEVFGWVGATNPMYDVLMHLPFSSYMTTNFDPLLAREANKSDHNCRRIMRYPDLDRAYVYDRTVYYIHGLIEVDEVPTTDQIVLSSRDFHAAYHAESPAYWFLAETFHKDPVCFVGCRLEERQLRDLFAICGRAQDDLRSRGGGDPPPRFILLPHHDSVLRSDANGRPVRDIAAERAEEAGEDAEYHSLGINVVRYEPVDRHHRGLLEMFEDLAGMSPELPVQFGWGEEY